MDLEELRSRRGRAEDDEARPPARLGVDARACPEDEPEPRAADEDEQRLRAERQGVVLGRRPQPLMPSLVVLEPDCRIPSPPRVRGARILA
jgi:hypothetical protein